MLGIDIKALNLAELRRLLDVARAREQHTLVEQLTAELLERPLRSAQRGVAPPWSVGRAAAPPRRIRLRLAVALTACAGGVLAGALIWGLSAPPKPVPSMTPVANAAPRVAIATAEPLPAAVDSQAAADVPPARNQPTANPCYDLPTPADRLVCGYPSLGRREQGLRSAYQAAIAAGSDPQALEAEQAAWRAGRDAISDRLALTDLYDQRIRELSETTP